MSRDLDDLAALELEATGGYRDGDVVMRVDSRNVVSEKAWRYISTRYWVCVSPDQHASWFGWCFSLSEPVPVSNYSMFWRRPVYAEAVRREEMFLDSPEHFRQCMADYESHNGRYRIPEMTRRHEPLRWRRTGWGDGTCLCCEEEGEHGLVTCRRRGEVSMMCHRCGAISDD